MFNQQVQSTIDRVDALREQVSDHYQIPAEEAKVLAQFVRAGGCRSVCEVGMSYGFSTLHLAAAARENGGRVHSIDPDARKVAAAREHLGQAGLVESVQLHQGRAQEVIPGLAPEQPFDFLFLDAIKRECFEYWDLLQPHLAKRALSATDNTSTHEDELRDFVNHLHALPGAAGALVPVGNGFDLTIVGV